MGEVQSALNNPTDRIQFYIRTALNLIVENKARIKFCDKFIKSIRCILFKYCISEYRLYFGLVFTL